MPGREGAGGRGQSLIRVAQRGRPSLPSRDGLSRLRRATAFSPWGVHGRHAAPFGGPLPAPPYAAWRGGWPAGPFPVSRQTRRRASNSGITFARALPPGSRLPEPHGASTGRNRGNGKVWLGSLGPFPSDQAPAHHTPATGGGPAPTHGHGPHTGGNTGDHKAAIDQPPQRGKLPERPPSNRGALAGLGGGPNRGRGEKDKAAG